ncbi:MAG: hypothetical protein ACRC8Y_23945 [Chroococcales cyanobacterium]
MESDPGFKAIATPSVGELHKIKSPKPAPSKVRFFIDLGKLDGVSEFVSHSPRSCQTDAIALQSPENSQSDWIADRAVLD